MIRVVDLIDVWEKRFRCECLKVVPIAERVGNGLDGGYRDVIDAWVTDIGPAGYLYPWYFRIDQGADVNLDASRRVIPHHLHVVPRYEIRETRTSYEPVFD